MRPSAEAPPFDVALSSASGNLEGTTSPRLEGTIFIACGLAWIASLIHIQAAIHHLNEQHALHAALFVLLALLQCGWGIAVYRRPTRPLLRTGALVSLLVAGLWFMSRTTGLPLGPEPWQPEAVGASDSIATANEVATALLVVTSYRLGNNSFVQRSVKQAVAAGGLAVILLSSLALVFAGHAH